MNNVTVYCRDQAVVPAGSTRNGSLLKPLKDLYARVQLIRTISAERKALAGLSDRDLLDIGITRSEAGLEARRRYYDLPRHRSW